MFAKLRKTLTKGMQFWTGAPKKHRLRCVDYDDRLRREEWEKMQDGWWGGSFRTQPTSNTERIYLDRWSDGRNNWMKAVIAVDSKSARLIPDLSDPCLLGVKPALSLKTIKIVFLTLPVCLLLAPFLLVARFVHCLKEKSRGMSRHHYAVLQKLRGNPAFNTTTEKLLVAAFRNERQISKK